MRMISDENSSDETYEVLELNNWENDKDNCLKIHSIDIIDDDKWRDFSASIENVDDVSVKLNEVIRQGKISKIRYFMNIYWTLRTCILTKTMAIIFML